MKQSQPENPLLSFQTIEAPQSTIKPVMLWKDLIDEVTAIGSGGDSAKLVA